MRAVQVIAPGKAIFVETPKPALQPGHVLVRTRQISLCGSDVHMLHYAHPAEYPFPPGTTGHEVVGVVEAADAPGAGLAAGDPVMALVRGQAGMAEYNLVPTEHIVPLPPGKPMDHLLQAQQLGTVIYAAKRLPNLMDQDVVVVGQGSAGLWFDFITRRMGARRVIGVDLQAHRLLLSSRYGATHTVHNATADPLQAVREITEGRLADVVVEAAGEAESINLSLELVKQYGFLLFFGVPRGVVMPFDMDRFFRKCVQSQTIVGAMNDPGQSCTWMAMELLASGIADPGPMITHHIPFERVMEAYDLQNTRDEGSVKIVVDFLE
jgi:L-iditol 2-dehydrogenase